MNHFRMNRNSGNLSNSSEIPISGALAGGQQAGGVTQHNTITAAPIVQESIRNDRVVEVQPIIHRSMDRNIVHHVERHIHEPAAPSMQGTFERPPLIQQEHHTNVVNEIQPIIHRERVVPVTEFAERHIVEHVAAPTMHTREVLWEQGFQGQVPQGQVLQQAQPTINEIPFSNAPMGTPYRGVRNSAPLVNSAEIPFSNAPMGTPYGTSAAIPYSNAPMGTPYGNSAATAGAGTGKRHHHGVLHRNAKA